MLKVMLQLQKLEKLEMEVLLVLEELMAMAEMEHHKLDQQVAVVFIRMEPKALTMPHLVKDLEMVEKVVNDFLLVVMEIMIQL